MNAPNCPNCGKPMTVVCMSCLGRSRSDKKRKATQANLIKARKAKAISEAERKTAYHLWWAKQKPEDRLSYMDWLARYMAGTL